MDAFHPHREALPALGDAQRELRDRIERNDPSVTPAEYDAFVLSRGRDDIACAVRDVLAGLRPALHIEHVLEVAMGTGIATRRLRELPGVAVHGIDLRADWMRFAVEHGRIEQGRAIGATFNALPFADGAFDLYTGLAFLNHRHDPAAFYREAHRVLATDGALFLPWVKPKPGSIEREASLMEEHAFRVTRREAWYLLAHKA